MSEREANPPIDTAQGCRAHAEQDRARAEAMDTENGRARLLRSAAAWDSRAGDLDSLAETSDVRRAQSIAEWNEGEAEDANEDDAGTA